MPSASLVMTPGLSSFLRSLKNDSIESSTEHLIFLLKRRQIRGPHSIAVATTQLLLQVVADFKGDDIYMLLERIKLVGKRLIGAQRVEMTVGNIVRRVLGLIREVAEDSVEGCDETESPSLIASDSDALHKSHSQLSIKRYGTLKSNAQSFLRSGPGATYSSLSSGPPSVPVSTSLFEIFSRPDTPLPAHTPVIGSEGQAPLPNQFIQALNQMGTKKTAKKDFRADVLEGVREILDELDQADDQIAANASDHIHSSEIILTHGSSATVQKFLLSAAKKRKFTVMHVESFPNDNEDTVSTLLKKPLKESDGRATQCDRLKPLRAAGITVVLVPDTAVFAVMSRVNKVILAPHLVLANGGLVAAAGARTLAWAAVQHKTPVVVLSGVYKISPVYPFNTSQLVEFGDPGKVAPYEDASFVDQILVVNPISDYVPPELVDLYLTNIGGQTPRYLYHIVSDHYRAEDINL